MKNFVLPILMGVVALVGMVFISPEVFAQDTSNTVTFTPIVNFGTIFESLKTSLGPMVAAALGLGLAIWGASYVFKIVKKMGR